MQKRKPGTNTIITPSDEIYKHKLWKYEDGKKHVSCLLIFQYSMERTAFYFVIYKLWQRRAFHKCFTCYKFYFISTPWNEKRKEN